MNDGSLHAATPATDLLSLLGQLAALPPEQRAILAQLLDLPQAQKSPLTADPRADDRLPPGFEKPQR